MTDADLQADLDEISRITKRWSGQEVANYVLVVLPAGGEFAGQFVVQANVPEAFLPQFLRDAAEDVEAEPVTDLPIGTVTTQ